MSGKALVVCCLIIAAMAAMAISIPSCVDGDGKLERRVERLEAEVETLRTSYMCRMFLNHHQTIPCRVNTQIELDATSYDPNGCFDATSHSYIVKKTGNYVLIGEVWYNWGAADGGVYSVQVRRNNEIIMERDDMCADPHGKDIQPHAVDIFPLMEGDRISLWTVFYKGGPCELKTVERQNYLTIFKLPS